VKIIGHCRFSWFGISDTGREIADIDTAQRVLWHPERMAIRFHLFEKIMLPSLLAQRDQSFELRLLVSEDMPQIYRDRLETTVAALPNIHILSTSERDIGRALRPTLKSSLGEDGKALHFRIDDDDALSSSYIARLRQILRQSDFDPGTAISFPTGVVSFFHQGRAKHAPYHKSYVAAGLAFVAGEGYTRNPFQVQHRQVGKRQMSFVDPGFLAFQVTLHTVNNTKGYSRIVHDSSASSTGVDRLLRNNPEIAAGAIVYPSLDRQITEAFDFADGAALRATLERTLDAKALACQFGFL
jgi:hypothetical protein